MAPITSRQHALVKEFRRVARGDARLALLDGWHLLEDAVRAHITIETVAVSRTAATPAWHRLLDRVRDSGTTVHDVSPRVLDAISPVRTPSGVVSLVERRRVSIPQLLSPSPPLVVLAVDVQDPGNVGALIRSADAGGATGLALVGTSADPWGWKALRASMGSTFRLPVWTGDDGAGLVGEIRRAAVTVLASVPRGGMLMHAVDMRDGVAIMIGSEGPGLTPEMLRLADARITVPMKPPVDSLNAAVAGALLVYEARRQREVRS